MFDNDAFEVLLHRPGVTAQKVTAKSSSTIAELLRGVGVDEGLLVFEGDDAADERDDNVEGTLVGGEKTVGELARGRIVAIHCHHCRHIRATVHYQSRSIERRFAPSARARRVLRWAKRKFELRDADADNLALFRCDSGEQVRENAHLGELVTDDRCEVCFDLAKDRNIEGNG